MHTLERVGRGSMQSKTTRDDTREKTGTESEEMERLTPDDQDHVTMSVTVDVSDMDERDTEVLQELSDLYENSFREVCEKNRDYSWSFLKTGCNLASTESTPFETPVRAQTYGLLTRTGDKRERLKENVFGAGDANVSDPAYKTAAECGNYWMMMSFLLQNPRLASDFAKL